MKKLKQFYTIGILLFTIQVFSQVEVEPINSSLVDRWSEYIQTISTTANTSDLSLREDKYQLVSSNSFFWHKEKWNKTYFSEYTYSKKGLLKKIYSLYKGDKNHADRKIVINYNEDGLLIDKTVILKPRHCRVDTTRWWVVDRKEIFEYNETNDIVSHIKQKTFDFILRNQWQKTYNYNQEGKNSSYVELSWSQKSMDWYNHLRNFIVYNSDQIANYEIMEVWLDKQWKKYDQINYEYNEEGLIIKHPTMGLYEYDENGRLIKRTMVKIYQLHYEYDENGNLIHVLQKSWKDEKWKDIFEIYYTYDLLSGNNEINISKSTISIFPNPSNQSEVTIVGFQPNSKLTIYDMAGKLRPDIKIHQSSASSAVLKNLTKGIYLIQIIDSNQNVITKVLNIM